MSKRKLEIELVPESCFGLNLAKMLPKKLWDIIRKDAIERAGNKCTICGAKVKSLHAHERWTYDIKTATQKLSEVIAVCPLCHSAIHMNRTYLVGNVERAENHYMKVNGISYAEMKEDLKKANEENLKRNSVHNWTQNFDYLRRFEND